MGWQDSPVVDEKPKWASSPEVADEYSAEEYSPPKKKESLGKTVEKALTAPVRAGAQVLGGVMDIGHDVANIAAGAVKGAGNIGATLLTPFDMAARALGVENSYIGRTDRRTAMDEGFKSLGNNPDSALFKTGELGGELAGVGGVSGSLGKGVAAYAPKLGAAIESGGLAAGKPAARILSNEAAKNAATRVAGGAMSGGAQAGLIDPETAKSGAAIGAAIPVVGKVLGASKDAAKALRSGAESLMKSALKPTPKDLISGDAAKAIDTMLENNIPATSKGIEQIRTRIDELNSQIKDVIANSTERVKTRKLMRPVAQKLKEFRQVNEEGDLAAIKKSWEEFKNNRAVKAGVGGVQAVKAEVANRDAAAAKALQDAWKLKTFEQQQKGLAHGGGIKSSVGQPEGQPYINVGGIGAKEKISPSAYPVRGMPRIAGKYTEQIERVPEGASGYKDAMSVYQARKAEAEVARSKLPEAKAKEGTISVQQAQALKQGTYKQLAKKYGQLGSADVEAQKAIARGLKEQVAENVPAVVPLNLEESKLFNVLDVAERKIVTEANKNPMGLAALRVDDPKAWAAFMADRSASAKSLLARIMNRASKKATGVSDRIESAVKSAARVAPTQASKDKQYEMGQHPALENQ